MSSTNTTLNYKTGEDPPDIATIADEDPDVRYGHSGHIGFISDHMGKKQKKFNRDDTGRKRLWKGKDVYEKEPFNLEDSDSDEDDDQINFAKVFGYQFINGFGNKCGSESIEGYKLIMILHTCSFMP